jgi:ATP synthase protein I
MRKEPKKENQEREKKDEEKARLAQQVGAYITIPFILLASPLVGWLLGSWLDKKFHTQPYLLLLCIFLGFLAGIREVIRVIKRFENGK